MNAAQVENQDLLRILATGPVDPWQARAAGRALSPIEWCVLASISDRLFELNDRGTPEPNLVASYTVSGNGSIYRFQVHAGRRFHDGEEVTADDVIHSLAEASLALPESARIVDATGSSPARGGTAAGVLRRISRYRFEVELKDRDDGFLHDLALPRNTIRSRKGGTSSLDDVSGPYQVVRREAGVLELRADRDHPAAQVRSFERIVIESPPDGEIPVDVTLHPLAAPGALLPGALSSRTPCAVLFAEPLPVPARATGPFRERLVRLPGERLYYLQLREDTPDPESLVRTLRQSLESPAAQKHYFGLKPPTFIPAGAAALHERGAGRAARPPHGPCTIALDGRDARPDFLAWLTEECRGRGVALRFDRNGPETPQAWLRSIFVGHSLDELGFFDALVADRPPGTRAPGKSFLAALAAARRVPTRNARGDLVRRLARDLVSELGVVPLFQATAGLLVDPRIDRESLASAAGFTSFVSLRRRSARFDHAELNRAMLTALGAATQMFAHDVRRPFSMVRILLDMVRNAGSLAEVKETAVRMMPEIERALGAVNGMIQDVLEIGSVREPVREVVSPEQVLDAGLREVFEARPGADVEFECRFAHSRPFHASPHQVHRVFANILSNAADAMQNRGRIWCETEDVLVGGQPFIRVAIGNTGSLIDPAELPRIFDAFYSRGKRGGTGLGLAITKKIIEAHEGRIWCVSDRAQGVQFCFTLPAHESEAAPVSPPPRHSREIMEEYQRRTALSLSEDERRTLAREKELATGLAAFRQAHRRRLRIWVIDDEMIYAEGVRDLVKDAFWFEENVEITALRDESAVWAALADGGPDACICDIDLGPDAPDGFAVTAELRRRGVEAMICMHSNRSVSTDYRHAIEAGADAFLPKPMSRPHLLRLLDETTRAMAPPPEDRLASGDPVPASREPVLIVVDDEVFMRKAWADRVQDARVLTYRGPSDFWAHHPSNGVDWPDIDGIITDYHFAAGEPESLEEFILRLREAGYAGPIILSSDTIETETIAGLINARIEKRPVAWREIRERLEEPPR